MSNFKEIGVQMMVHSYFGTIIGIVYEPEHESLLEDMVESENVYMSGIASFVAYDTGDVELVLTTGALLDPFEIINLRKEDIVGKPVNKNRVRASMEHEYREFLKDIQSEFLKEDKDHDLKMMEKTNTFPKGGVVSKFQFPRGKQ